MGKKQDQGSEIAARAAAALAGVREAEAALEKRLRTKCRWFDPDDVNEFRRLTRREDRLGTLDRLVPDRICPCCAKQRLGLRQWCVDEDETTAVCRRCFHRGTIREGQALRLDLVGKKIVRYEIDGQELRRVREAAGVSLRALCRAAAPSSTWSPGRLSRIETAEGFTSVTEDAMAELRRAFWSLGISVLG